MTKKKILTRIAGALIGLACDAAIIHNFVRPEGRWSVYCERYIGIYMAISIVILVLLIPNVFWLSLRDGNPKYHYGRKDMFRSLDECYAPSLWHRTYFLLNSVPMLIFTGVFAGRTWLFTVWLLYMGADELCRYYRRRFYQRLDAGEVGESKAEKPDSTEDADERFRLN